MKKVRLGRTNLEVTKLGLGGIPLSTLMGGTTEDVIDQVINAALDGGINFIDTSRVYMDSETHIGNVMKTRRKECILASKSYNRDYDAAFADIEESLNQLQTDHIDIYQIHALYPDQIKTVMGKGGALEAFRKAKEQGMISHIGLTSHHNSVLIELVKTGEFDTIMFPFNVIEREPEKELIPLAQSLDIGTLIMKPLAGSAIRDRKKAFAFFNAYPVDLILNGISSLAELTENLTYFENDASLTSDELSAFEKEVSGLGKDFCRRCSYCMPCPNDIHIPDMIHVFYQAVKSVPFDEIPPEKREMGKNLLVWLQACESCGQCEKKCPYNLPTPKRVKELIKMFS